jgi:hypothetical protein
MTEQTKPQTNKHGQTCQQTCGSMGATGFHSLLCWSVERLLNPKPKEPQA